MRRGCRIYTAICTAPGHPRHTTVRAAGRLPGSGPTPDVFSGRSNLLRRHGPRVSVTDSDAVTSSHCLRPADKSCSLYEFVGSKHRVPLKVSGRSSLTVKCQRFLLKSPTGGNLLSSAAFSKVPREKQALLRPAPQAPGGSERPASRTHPRAHSPLGVAAAPRPRGGGAVTFQRPRLSVRSRFRGASPASASPAESRVLLEWVLFFPFRLPWNADGKTYPRTLHAPQPSLSEPHGAPALTSGHGMGELCVSKLRGAVP